MLVVATAGHVDHGKSTLVRALTGMEPDRLAEERRRGLTIDLGFAWTELPSGREVAFVDVPGHERFTTNMLAGVGPVPAVLLVVAADGGWAPQTAEHVAALDALGVAHGILAVTRADLADPGAAVAAARAQLAPTTLADLPVVVTSAVTGDGLDELRAALDGLADEVPVAPPTARIRLWIDRAFAVRGFGTIVTGTLPAGRISAGDTLEVDGETVVVRGIERLGRPAASATAVARVAANLRAAPRGGLRRGQALLTPGAWWHTAEVDVRLGHPEAFAGAARHLVAHIGSAAVGVALRPVGTDHLRLRLERPLPLEVGDRLLLRDPGLRRLLGGTVVVDPDPPSLRPRGATRRRASALADAPGEDVGAEVQRRGAVRVTHLRRLGVVVDDPVSGVVEAAGWLVAPGVWAGWRRALVDAVGRDHAGHLVRDGLTQADAVRAALLPAPALLEPLVASCPELEVADGRVRCVATGPVLHPRLAARLDPLLGTFRSAPFAAPTADDLAAAGLTSRDLAAAAAAGAVLRLPGDVVLPPDAADQAAARLAGLAQPFSVSAARQALVTSRRVAVPLLEHLDRLGRTRRVDANLRVVVPG